MPAPPPIAAPTQIGPYRIQRVLGTGTMASVYLADQEGPGGFRKRVALKVVKQEFGEDDTFIRMLMREAQIGGMLRHPNVIQTLSFEQYGGSYVLVLEYVEGETLDLLLAPPGLQRGSLPASLALDIAIQVCRGLHHAHSMKDEDGQSLVIVHRDLKPANIIRTSHGLVKIMDFGIARATAAWAALTAQGVIRGTPAYMSPEQVLGRELDGRSDLFSLGSILWEVLVGEVLWKGPSMLKVMERVVKADLGDGLSRADRLLPGVGKVLKRLLAVSPNDRFSDAIEASEELKKLLLNQGQVGATQSRMATLDELGQQGEGKRVVVPPDLRKAAKEELNATRNHAGTIGLGAAALSGQGRGFGRTVQPDGAPKVRGADVAQPIGGDGAGSAQKKASAAATMAAPAATGPGPAPRVGRSGGDSRPRTNPAERAPQPAAKARRGAEDDIADFTYHEEPDEDVEELIFFEDVEENTSPRGTNKAKGGPQAKAAASSESAASPTKGSTAKPTTGSPPPDPGPAFVRDDKPTRGGSPSYGWGRSPGEAAPSERPASADPPPASAKVGKSRGTAAHPGSASHADGPQAAIAATAVAPGVASAAAAVAPAVVSAATAEAPAVRAMGLGDAVAPHAVGTLEAPSVRAAQLGETAAFAEKTSAKAATPRGAEEDLPDWAASTEPLPIQAPRGPQRTNVVAKDRLDALLSAAGHTSLAPLAPLVPLAPSVPRVVERSVADEGASTGASSLANSAQASAPQDPADATDTLDPATLRHAQAAVLSGLDDRAEGGGSPEELDLDPLDEGEAPEPEPTEDEPAATLDLPPQPALGAQAAGDVHPSHGDMVLDAPAADLESNATGPAWSALPEAAAAPVAAVVDENVATAELLQLPEDHAGTDPGRSPVAIAEAVDEQPEERSRQPRPDVGPVTSNPGATPQAVAEDARQGGREPVGNDRAAPVAPPDANAAAAPSEEEWVEDLRFPGAEVRAARERAAAPEEDDLWSRADGGEESPELVEDASEGLFMDDGEDELWSEAAVAAETAPKGPASAFHLPTLSDVLDVGVVGEAASDEPSFLDEAWALAEEAWRRQEDEARHQAEAAARRTRAEALAAELAARDAEQRRVAISEAEQLEREASELLQEAENSVASVARAVRGWRRAEIDEALSAAELCLGRARMARDRVRAACERASTALDGPSARAATDDAVAHVQELRTAASMADPHLQRAREAATHAREEAQARERALDEARAVELAAADEARRAREAAALARKAAGPGDAASRKAADEAEAHAIEAERLAAAVARPATAWEPLTVSELERALHSLREDAERVRALASAGQSAAGRAAEEARREDEERQRQAAAEARRAQQRLDAAQERAEEARASWFVQPAAAVGAVLAAQEGGLEVDDPAVYDAIEALRPKEQGLSQAVADLRALLDAVEESLDADDAEQSLALAETAKSGVEALARALERDAESARSLAFRVRDARRRAAAEQAEAELQRARLAEVEAEWQRAAARWGEVADRARTAGLSEESLGDGRSAAQPMIDPIDVRQPAAVEAALLRLRERVAVLELSADRLETSIQATLASKAEAARLRVDGARQRAIRALDRVRRSLQQAQDALAVAEGAAEAEDGPGIAAAKERLDRARQLAAQATRLHASARKTNKADEAERLADEIFGIARTITADAAVLAEALRLIDEARTARRLAREGLDRARAAWEGELSRLERLRDGAPLAPEVADDERPRLGAGLRAWLDGLAELGRLAERLRNSRPPSPHSEAWHDAAASARSLTLQAIPIEARVRELAVKIGADLEALRSERRSQGEARARLQAALQRIEASRKLAQRAVRQAQALPLPEGADGPTARLDALRAAAREIDDLTRAAVNDGALRPDENAAAVRWREAADVAETLARRAESAALRATEALPLLKRDIQDVRQRRLSFQERWQSLQETLRSNRAALAAAVEHAELAAEEAPGTDAVELHQRAADLAAPHLGDAEDLPALPLQDDAAESLLSACSALAETLSRAVTDAETLAIAARNSADRDAQTRSRLIAEVERWAEQAERRVRTLDDALRSFQGRLRTSADPDAQAAVDHCLSVRARIGADLDAIRAAARNVAAMQAAVLAATFHGDAAQLLASIEAQVAATTGPLAEARRHMDAAEAARAARDRARRSVEQHARDAAALVEELRGLWGAAQDKGQATGLRAAHLEAARSAAARATADEAAMRAIVDRASLEQDRDAVESLQELARETLERVQHASMDARRRLGEAEALAQAEARRSQLLDQLDADLARALAAAERATESALIAEEALAAGEDGSAGAQAERAALAAGAAGREATRARRAARIARDSTDLPVIEARAAEIRRAADEAESQARRAGESATSEGPSPTRAVASSWPGPHTPPAPRAGSVPAPSLQESTGRFARPGGPQAPLPSTSSPKTAVRPAPPPPQPSAPPPLARAPSPPAPVSARHAAPTAAPPAPPPTAEADDAAWDDLALLDVLEEENPEDQGPDLDVVLAGRQRRQQNAASTPPPVGPTTTSAGPLPPGPRTRSPGGPSTSNWDPFAEPPAATAPPPRPAPPPEPGWDPKWSFGDVQTSPGPRPVPRAEAPRPAPRPAPPSRPAPTPVDDLDDAESWVLDED